MVKTFGKVTWFSPVLLSEMALRSRLHKDLFYVSVMFIFSTVEFIDTRPSFINFTLSTYLDLAMSSVD